MMFKYYKPQTIEELSELKAKYNSKLISGGTDLMVKMRAKVIKPEAVIDTKGLGKEEITFDGCKVRIPLNTTYDDLLNNKEFCDRFSMVVDIIKQIGSPQIRNRATPIGNIGNASPAGDFLLATYVFHGYAEVKPYNKKVRVHQLIDGPGKLRLKPEEFIYSIELKERPGFKYYYEKVGKRNAMNISIISLGLLVKLDGDNIEELKIAYGSVGPTVVRFKELEDEVVGKKFSKELFEELAEKYYERIHPITDVRASSEYRKKMVKNLMLKAYYNLK